MSPAERYKQGPVVETIEMDHEADSKPSHQLVQTVPADQHSTHQQFSYDLERLQQRDMVLQHLTKRLNFVVRLLGTIMAMYCLASMLYALITYNNTKNKKLGNGRYPWSPQTVLWPTYLVLATAAVTVLMNTITMCLYFKSFATADRSDRISGYIGIALTGAKAVVWAANAGLFKMANTGNDLWGWSCSPAADALEQRVKGILDFNVLCQVQSWTWYVTLAEAALYLITFAIYVIMFMLWINGRRMRRRKQRLLPVQLY